MGRRTSVVNVVSRVPQAKANSIVIGICCFVFTVIFYSAKHLTGPGSLVTKCSPRVESIGQYQQYLLWTLQPPSEKDDLQAPQSVHDATEDQKSAKPVPNLPSTAAQVAHDATIKLQYAMNSSTISKIEGANLLSMSRHISTFTRLLDAILADTSINRRPFLHLREKYFGWWNALNTTHLPWKATNHTTGIVLTAGEGNMVLAGHAIRTLRNVVKTDLPIQVMYAGEDDLPGRMRKRMKSLDPKLELINILDHYDEGVAGLKGGGYAIKPFAALASSFEKVIIIDADTIFMQRPDEWFDKDEALKRTGTLFFHDRAYNGRKTTDWIKEVLQESGRMPSNTLSSSMYWQEELEHQQESGVVFFDKAIPSAFMSLLFTTYMNILSVRAQLYGQVAGDKETFWLASELAGIPYAFNPSYASIIGSVSVNDQGLPEICAPQPLQTDMDGRPFWFNSGLMEDKTNVDNTEYANLTHYIPGSSHEQPVGGWRFVHDHTFCLGRDMEQIRSLKADGMDGVAERLVEEARAVDKELKSGPL